MTREQRWVLRELEPLKRRRARVEENKQYLERHFRARRETLERILTILRRAQPSGSRLKSQIESDAFHGGYCCALSVLAAVHGISTAYEEAVGAVNPRELLNFARRTNDMELPNIRAAIRALKSQGVGV